MKKTFLIFALIGITFLLGIFSFQQYPNTIIVTSLTPTNQDIYTVNDQQIEQENGVCVVFRDQKNTTITLKRNEQTQSIFLQRGLRFSISTPKGNELGLVAIRANDRPDLRSQFGCAD